jgi:hypothetical protein
MVPLPFALRFDMFFSSLLPMEILKMGAENQAY